MPEMPLELESTVVDTLCCCPDNIYFHFFWYLHYVFYFQGTALLPFGTILMIVMQSPLPNLSQGMVGHVIHGFQAHPFTLILVLSTKTERNWNCFNHVMVPWKEYTSIHIYLYPRNNVTYILLCFSQKSLSSIFSLNVFTCSSLL